MSDASFFTAAAIHGCYGPRSVETAFGATREHATRNVLEKLWDQLQPDDQQRLDNEIDGIIEFLKTHDRWNGGDSDKKSVNDDYIHIVIEPATFAVTIDIF